MSGEGAQDTPALAVRMFGEFSIRYGERELTGNLGRSKKVWSLIEYLLAHRGKEIPQERMMEDLWPEEEFDNPAHILKNMVYRARTALKTLCGEEQIEFIVYDHNGYMWNTAIPCVIDIESFESCWKLAQETADPTARLSYMRRAFEQYTGEFLPGLSYFPWVIAKSAYYASQYHQCVRALAEEYLQRRQYGEAINVCGVSIGFSPFEEEIHRLLLLAYAKDGQYKMAAAHYQRISQQFYDEFGVPLSPETSSLYREIVRSIHSVEMDLVAIKEDLKEVSRLNGAFFCDYAIFKNIYRINARVMARSGISMHIGLITITDERGEIPPAQALKRVMAQMQSCVVENLRRGDTVAQYSATQLVLMLPQTTRENGCQVLSRLIALYKSKYPMERYRIEYRLEAVDPAAG